MSEKKILVTIGREFGSGGRQVGRLLAESLGIPFYDRDLIYLVSEKTGYSPEVLEKVDEKPSGLFTSMIGGYTGINSVSPYIDVSMNDKLFLVQADIIKKAAQAGSAVFVGRCSNYVLDEEFETIDVFVNAPLSYRVKRAVEVYGVPEDKAENVVRKTDKKRASYYNFYSNRKWGKASDYDICVNTSHIGVEGTVELLKRYVELRNR